MIDLELARGNAGFIVGFDAEKDQVADAIVDLVEEAAIPGAIVNPLAALCR